MSTEWVPYKYERDNIESLTSFEFSVFRAVILSSTNPSKICSCPLQWCFLNSVATRAKVGTKQQKISHKPEKTRVQSCLLSVEVLVCPPDVYVHTSRPPKRKNCARERIQLVKKSQFFRLNATSASFNSVRNCLKMVVESVWRSKYIRMSSNWESANWTVNFVRRDSLFAEKFLRSFQYKRWACEMGKAVRKCERSLFMILFDILGCTVSAIGSNV